MEQIDYVTIFFLQKLKEKPEVRLNQFRSRILALARKVVVVVVFSSFTCALLIRCMKYNYVSQWPRRLFVAMARCFKKTYIGLQLLETCACISKKDIYLN